MTDSANKTYGFRTASIRAMTMDANSNMIKDKNKGITAIAHNHLNLPESISFGNWNISYIYDATGTKLSKKVIETGKPDVLTHYAGNYVYEGSSLKFIFHSEGYVDADGASDSGGFLPPDPGGIPWDDPAPPLPPFIYAYQYKDHLGNVRLAYMDRDNNGSINTVTEILEENNYYPFGLQHQGYNHVVTSTNPGQKYKYNGKELQDELGLNHYDYGARFYDPAVGRWFVVDPLAEQAPAWTPYRYGFNNPLSFVDPDGLYEWRVNSETGEYERFGDKGGDEEQHIYFNDDKEATNVMKGATIYVGATAQNRYKDGEISYAVSTKDLWSDLPDEYQGAYTTGDLVERYQAQQKGGEKYNSIRAQEEQGLARRDQIWNNRDMSNRLYEKYGSTSGLWLAVETRLFEEMIPGPSSVPSRAGKNNFSPTFKPSSTQLSNNSWIRFLQTNKGKYKGLGKNWINQAAKDYQALKEAGKL